MLLLLAAAFLGLLKKDQGPRAQQLGPVVDSGDGYRHAGNHHRDVLTILPTSFLMHQALGPPVQMLVGLLGYTR